ncbi:MAG: response regulator [Bacillota bacterium]
MAPRALRILLIDDHNVLRNGLRLLLETQPDMRVVGEAADGEEGLALTRRLKPELVILDLSMPGLGGLDTLRRMVGEQPWMRVLILTMHDDPEFVRDALTAGARGYVLKKAADNELLTAIRQVAAGETYVYPSLAARLVTQGVQTRASREQPGREHLGNLSAREMEVLKLIALGYTHQEIGERLGVSVKTVETHKARISEKLELRTRAELVRYAMQNNLVQLE